jgi:hypothetical protein
MGVRVSHPRHEQKSYQRLAMAIARDSNLDFLNENDDSGLTQTRAFNNVAGNLLLVGVRKRSSNGNNNVTGVTYNGVAMTLVDRQFFQSGTNDMQLFYLLNPATGTHNVVLTYVNVADDHGFAAVSYSVVKQSAFPDATHKTTGNSTTVSDTITFVNTPAWVVMFTVSASSPLAASTNSTLIGTASAVNFFDSNATQTGSTFNMQATTPSAAWGDIMVSFVAPSSNVATPFMVRQAVQRASSF